MFGISFPELIVVMMVVLLAVGPDKLPEAARKFGKIMGDLRRTSDSVRREFYRAVYEPVQDTKQQIKNETRELVAVKNQLSEFLDSELNCEQKAKLAAEKKQAAEPAAGGSEVKATAQPAIETITSTPPSTDESKR